MLVDLKQDFNDLAIFFTRPVICYNQLDVLCYDSVLYIVIKKASKERENHGDYKHQYYTRGEADLCFMYNIKYK